MDILDEKFRDTQLQKSTALAIKFELDLRLFATRPSKLLDILIISFNNFSIKLFYLIVFLSNFLYSYA